MAAPFISIVIPTLNEEKYLPQTLRSIKNQKTAHSYEIIIADSKSEDKTREIARQFGCRIVDAPKGIIAAGRQAGCKIAKGKIIVSANADVKYAPQWLEELIKPLIQGKAVATLGKLLTLDGNTVENAWCRYFFRTCTQFSLIAKIPLAYAENMAMTREAFEAVGGFNETLVTGEDTDLAKKLQKYGKISFCKKAIAHVSLRRVRKWGYLKFLSFHAKNYITSHLTNKMAHEYEPIR